MNTPFFQKGQKVKFSLEDLSVGDFGAEEVEEEKIKELDGCTATILELATDFHVKGDTRTKDHEYYDLKFEDGTTLAAVSGYHLTEI